MLTLKNIRKSYGIYRVLEKVSFSLGEAAESSSRWTKRRGQIDHF